MRGDACAETSYRMAENRMSCQLPIVEAVHHCDMRAEIARPAHAYSRKHCDIVPTGKARCDKPRNQPYSCTGSTESRDWNSYRFCRRKAEQRIQNEINFVCEERKERNSLVRLMMPHIHRPAGRQAPP